MTWPFGALKMFGYDVVVADVPAHFDLYGQASSKAAAGQYDVMSDAELSALPVGHLVRQHGLLLYWTTGWAIATGRAQAIVRAWGAEPVTEIVWLKTTRNGLRRTGTGYRVRTRHEPIILAKWGNPQHTPFPSDFPGIARRHSEKPDEFYSMVVAHTLGAWRCDLFSAGIVRPGFDGWGEDHRSKPEEKGKYGTRRRTETASARGQHALFGTQVPAHPDPDR